MQTCHCAVQGQEASGALVVGRVPAMIRSRNYRLVDLGLRGTPTITKVLSNKIIRHGSVARNLG
jgi:hypothetical protein